MLRFSILVSKTFLLSFFLASSAFAQNSPNGNDQNLEGGQSLRPDRNLSGAQIEEVLARTSARLKITKDSRFYENLRSSLLATAGKGSATVQFTNPAIGQAEEIPVVKHIKGKIGSPIPTAKELEPKIEIPEGEIRSAMDEQVKEAWAYVRQMQELKDLPQCLENKTEKFESGFEGHKDDKTVTLDMLFMDKSDVPVSKEELFGQQTSVKGYSAEAKDGESYAASFLKIPCLPYRIRITPGWVFHHFGSDALKNFDKNPLGSGKFHPTIKEKFGVK